MTGERGRIERDELLEHPTRRAIVEALEKHPGMNRAQLAIAVGVPLVVLDFHVHRL